MIHKKIVIFAFLTNLASFCAIAEESQEIEKIQVDGKLLPKLSTSVSGYALYGNMAIEALHAKNYERALELLEKSAKQGNKQSQFYLSKMYFKGLGTEVNNKLGWVWLNVALEQKTPEWNFVFKKVSEAIPNTAKNSWQDEVELFISNYGADATNHKCRRERPLGSNIVQVICIREYDGTHDPLDFRSIQALFMDG